MERDRTALIQIFRGRVSVVRSALMVLRGGEGEGAGGGHVGATFGLYIAAALLTLLELRPQFGAELIGIWN